MPDLFDPSLTKPLADDRAYLRQTALPIVTLSAVTKEDVKKLHRLPNENASTDIVLSRAHFSMALAVAKTAWKNTIDPNKAWLVDPTNYITKKDWLQVSMTEQIGKTIARHSFLKSLKDFIDRFGRKKLPIIDSVTTPLLFLTQEVHTPILCLHISAGNVLIEQGKTVLQVVTDPHIRSDYLQYAQSEKLYWCVFDEATKMELLEKAALLDKEVDPKRVFVTGAPIDPDVLQARVKKYPWRSGPLKLCLTNGGLGTNKSEIKRICEQLLPRIASRHQVHQPEIHLLIYAGTQADIYHDIIHLAAEYGLVSAPLAHTKASFRVIYHPQLTDANQLLLKYGFGWAHGFISKPSGDMAYDAAASGNFLLTLNEWGEWEHAIRQRFESLGIARRAQTDNILDQLEVLTASDSKAQSWVESAQEAALKLKPELTHGAKHIIAAYQSIT